MDFYDTNNMSYADIQLHFERLSREFGYPIKPDEGYINHCGYIQLQANNFEGALGIFKQNIKCYPKSFNVYDSLGEAWFKKGERALAISNYEKSIVLNPNNQNAKEMLIKLRTAKPEFTVSEHCIVY